MDRRIIRHVAWFIVFAMLLPMAGIAEDPAVYEVAAAAVDEVVTVSEAEAVPEESAELELGAEEDAPEETKTVPEPEIIETPADENPVDPEAEDAPEIEEGAQPEEAPQTDELSQPEEAPQAEEVPEAEEAPEAGDAAENEEAPQAEEPQTEEAPQAEPEAPVEAAPVETQPEAPAEAAPAAAGAVELIEEAQPKLAEAATIPAAIMLGVKEKYQLPPMGDGFATSKKAVATVSPTGLITAKKKGTAVITVTAGGAQIATCQVSVKAAPKKVSLPKKQQIVSGQSVALTAKVSGGYSSTITWTSSNPGVAMVDANGLVTGVGIGKAKITAKTYNKKKAVCTVTVDSPFAPTSVGFSTAVFDVGLKESVVLTPVVNPGAEATFTFTSKNKKVASVGKTTGIVKGKKLGKTKVTVKTQNGKKATLTIRVMKAPKSVSIDIPAATLNVGGAIKLTAILPAKTASQITWISSNPGVATVDATGTVVGVGGGAATITAMTFNGKVATSEISVNAPAPAPAPAAPAAPATPATPTTPTTPATPATPTEVEPRAKVQQVADELGISVDELAAETGLSVKELNAMSDEALDALKNELDHSDEPTAPEFTIGDDESAVKAGEDLVINVSAKAGDTYTAALYRDGAVVSEVCESDENGIIRIPTAGLSGEYTVSVTSVKDGTTTEKTVTIEASASDEDKPEFNIGNSDGKVTSGSDLVINVAAKGAEDESYTATLYDAKGNAVTEAIAWNPEDGTITIPTGELPYGDYKVAVTGTVNGETSTAEGKVTVETLLEVPTFKLNTTKLYHGAYFQIDVTNENLGLNEFYNARLVNVDDSEYKFAFSIDNKSRGITIESYIPEGTYALTVTAGRNLKDGVQETLDAEPVSVTIGAAPELDKPSFDLPSADIDLSQSDSLTLSVTPQGLGETYTAALFAGDTQVTGSDQSSWDADAKKLTLDLTFVDPGEYTLRVTATSGEKSTNADAAVKVVVTPAAPEFEILYLNDGKLSKADSSTMLIRVKYQRSGVSFKAALSKGETLLIDDFEWIEGRGQLERSISDLDAGKYSLTVTAYSTGGEVSAEPVTFTLVGDFEMEGGVVTGYNGDGGEIVIPEVDYDEKPITAIGAGVFSGKAITAVTIPKDVTEIGESAFEDCDILQSVVIPDGVTTIGAKAFKGCVSLSSMTTFS